MYAMLKPDTAYVRRAKANELVWDESISVTNAQEIEELDDE
jgi:triphosphoribosyl-dephospho-CoA synthetase